MRCLIISDTTTHSKYWYYKYVQLLGGRKHTFAPPHFSYWGGAAPPRPPLSTPLVTPHATMSAAVRRVVDGESLRIISREFEIPRSTLSRYVSVYKQDETAILEANFKKAQIFSDEQE